MGTLEELIAELSAYHQKGLSYGSKLPVCEACAELCHSHSGLGCDDPDGAWPCGTMRIVNKYLAAG